ncbi:hypothetical protein HDU85_007257 [Gaertneriomyces sp. JEL0708]|nr:hypothetical protein HDU85_007257 [Gaertneriomyces sp. JEL0708]
MIGRQNDWVSPKEHSANVPKCSSFEVESVMSQQEMIAAGTAITCVIDRGHGKPRSIRHHEELLRFVQDELNKANLDRPLTVHSFDASGHVRDHIDLFRRARIVIGPHGAGLINLYWAKPGTYAVEVGYDKLMILPEMYAEMALHLDHKYYLCKGKGTYMGPIDVDMDDMKWIMDHIITDMKSQKS